MFLVTLMRMGGLFNADDFASELKLSRFISVIMLCGYALYLYFQLKTHVHLFNDDDADDGAGAESSQSALTRPLSRSEASNENSSSQSDGFDVRLLSLFDLAL